MAAKKRKRASGGGGSKTQFVLGLPRDLSAKEVVTKAKEKGLKLSEAYVYKIRSSSKGDAPEPMKVPRPPSGGGMSKVEFVRSLPPGTSYADAAAQAKPLGIELSRAYFYVLKSGAKKTGRGNAQAPKTRGPGSRRAAATPSRSSMSPRGSGLRLRSDDQNEQALLDAVRSLGADRARSLIAAVETFERG
jgi:hypothetical protein